MAQKKGLIYRLTMGKDNLPDFTPNRLPGSRWAVFKDVFFNRIGAMVKISLLTILFMLPALAWLIFMSLVKRADATVVPYSANIGLGYPVVTDAIAMGTYRTFMFNIQTYAVLIPLIMIAGIGFAGAFHTMKLLGWGEGVSVGGTFFTGVKRNWVNFLWIFLFAGVSIFVFMFNISAYGQMTSIHKAWKIIAVSLSCVQLVLMLCMLLYLCTQNVTYKLGFVGLVKNSFLFSIALFPQNIFFLICSILPFILIMLLPMQIAIFFWMIVIFLGPAYVVLIWTVFSQYVFDKYVNDRVKGAVKNRGMYVKNPEDEKSAEIEKIRTRNTAYGSAYVSRRLSSIDDGKSFTPLETNFSRNDLKRLSDEKREMQAEIEKEKEEVTAAIEQEVAAYEEEQSAKKKGKKHKSSDEKTESKTVKKEKKKKKFSETDIATMPVSDEEYVDDDKND